MGIRQRLLFVALAWTVAYLPRATAQTLVYWDTNSTTGGTGTTGGTWDNATTTAWSNNSGGTGTTGKWNAFATGANSVAIFSAGSNATNAFTVTTSGAINNVGGITFEEGTVTIGGTGTLNLSQAATINTNANTATISAAMAGAFAVTKSGSGTLILSGTNTYTGATTISQGTLQVNANAPSGASGALGNATSAITVNNANTGANNTSLLIGTSGVTVGRAISVANQGSGTTTLGGNLTTGTGTFSGAVTLNKSANVNADGTSNITFSGAISGAGGLTKTGNGTIILTNNDGFTGATTINSGVLQLGNGSTNGNLTGTSSVTNNGALAFNEATAVTWNRTISGVGNVTVSGGGPLTISTAQNYTGATTVNSGGTLTNNVANAIGSSSAVTVDGTWSLNNFSDTVGSIAGNGTISLLSGNLTAGGNNASTSFTGTITGTGGLTKLGNGTLTISGANTFSGATNIGAAGGSTTGTLALGASNSLGTGNVNIYTGTLAMGSFSDTVAALTMGGGANGSTAAVTGSGTLTLGGNVTYDATNNPGTATIGANVALNGNRTFNIGASASSTPDMTVTGTISGTNNGITKTGAGVLQLAGTNTYTGITTVSAGTLSVTNLANGGTASSIGGSNATATNLVLNGGTLQYAGSAAATTNRLFTLGTAGATIDVTGAGNVSFTGTGNVTISGSGNRVLTLSGDNTGGVNTLAAAIGGTTGITKVGTNEWKLTGNNGYSGNTTISAGTLSIAQIGSLGSSTNNLILDGGTLKYAAANNAVTQTSRLPIFGAAGGTLDASGSGTSTIEFTNGGSVSFTGTGARTVTFSGTNTGNNRFNSVIADSAVGVQTSVVKTGSGTWMFDGNNANTYTGNTTINSGTLLLDKKSNRNATGTGDIIVGDGTNTATVQYYLTSNQLGNNSNVYINNNGTFNINGLTDSMGAIGDGALTSGGFGQLILGSGGNLTVGASGISTTFSGTISGGASSSLTTTGAGTWTLAGNSTGLFSGSLTVSQGGLNLANAGALGTASLTLGSGSTIDNTTGSALTLSNAQTWNNFTFTGSNALTVGGSVMLNSDTTVTTAGATLTITGTVDDGSHTYNLAKSGNGTLVLAGNNSYGGTTTVGQGTLQVGNGGTSGTLGSGSVTDNAALVFDRSDNTTVSNSISGSGSIAQSGSGALTLSGTNSSFSGTIAVNQGTLIAGSNSSLGSTSSSITVASNAALGMSANITTTAGNLTISGTGVSNSGALYNVSGNSTFAGSVALSGNATIASPSGTLTVGSTSPAFSPSGHTQPTESGYVTIGGSTLTFQGAGNITVNDRVRDFVGQTAGWSYTNATTINYSPQTTNPGNVIVDMNSAAAKVSFVANANSYTGTTFVKNGTLVVDTISNNNTGAHDPTTDSFHGINGAIEIGNGTVGATLKLGSTTLGGSANEVLASTSTIKIYQDGTFNVNNQSQSIGAMTFSGGGTVLLGTSGHLYLNDNVTVTAGSSATISTTGSGVVDLTLHRVSGVDTGDVTRVFDVGSLGNLTIGAIIQGNVGGSNIANLYKDGTGTLTLTGLNTYNGVTTVANGVLNIQRATSSGTSALGSTAAGTVVNSGGTLQLQNLQGGTVPNTMSGETLTIAGSGFGGNGALQNVAGNNVWQGGITVNGANARIQADSGTTLTINTGGISGTNSGSLEVGGIGNTTVASSIGSTVGGVKKNGSGTLLLSGSNSFVGPVTIDAGTVSAQNDAALGSGNTVTVNNGGTLAFDSTAKGSNLNTLSATVNIYGTGSGNGAIRNTAGANTFNGSVNVASAATITANSTTSLTISGNISSTGTNTLTVGGSTAAGTNGSMTFSGPITNATGTLNINKEGSVSGTDGRLTISGGGTAGVVNLNGGTMTISSAALTTGNFTTLSGTSLLIASGGTLNIAGTGSIAASTVDSLSTGTIQVSGNYNLSVGTNTASNLTLKIGGTTSGSPATLTLLGNVTIGTLEITGDTILDFGNSATTVLTSGVLTISNPNATIQVKNWVTSTNIANADLWKVTGTIGNGTTSRTLGNGTLDTSSPLTQVTWVAPGGSTGNTTTWVGDTSQGWYDHEIRPTPEPSTYGLIFVSGCVGFFGWRRYRRRKSAIARAEA